MVRGRGKLLFEWFAKPHSSVLPQQIPNLGTLTLQWRTATGGVGTLGDYELMNVPEQTQALELRLVSFPPSVEVC